MASIPQETVTVEAQDGHEINDTSWDDRNGLFTHYAGTVGTDHNAGYLFTGVPVGQGDTIDAATVTVYVFTTHGAPETLLRGNIGDATAWASERPSQMSATTASQAGPTSTGSQGITATSIVQEIVDDGSWATGQDMKFALFNDYGGAESYYNLYIIDVNTYSHTGDFAKLDIDYTEGGGGDTFAAYYQQHYRSLVSEML